MSEKPQPRKPSQLSARLERIESLLEKIFGDRLSLGQSDETPCEEAMSDVEERVAAMEKLLDRVQPKEGIAKHAERGTLRYCAVPATPSRTFAPDVSRDRVRLIQAVDKKWVNGTVLHYCFFPDSPEEQVALVRKGFEIWAGVGIGVKFEEVTDIASAAVRIGFVQGDGCWSYIGRDVIDIPGRNERTMNFGWDLQTDPRREYVAVHEIGHTLGFPHEHQNPFAGIVWDEDAVYKYFGAPPNSWSRDTTENNILRKLLPTEVMGTQWDPNSIMHYAFAAGLILKPEQYKVGLTPHGDLSAIDIAEALALYPRLDDSANAELKPLQSQILKLAPAQQANFVIKPSTSATYTMRTFGGSDAVMVLFEDAGGSLRKVDADDDSGVDRNVQITARLEAGKKYFLRIRMYSSFDSGDVAVMLWAPPAPLPPRPGP